VPGKPLDTEPGWHELFSDEAVVPGAFRLARRHVVSGRVHNPMRLTLEDVKARPANTASAPARRGTSKKNTVTLCSSCAV
jgi:hypothetical protein